jgi:hypothetical protein
MINNRTPFDLKVAVNGTSWDVLFNNTSIVSGNDPDLVSGRKVGILSWAQLSDTDETPDPPYWGTEVENLKVMQGANTLYNETFATRSVAFRQLVMTNSAGVSGLSATQNKDLLGNFGLSIDHPWVYQQNNGFVNATATAPNTDFIGPAVVVDEPGAASMTDYQMQVRLGASDNDGFGVLVRAADDNNFYRINFTTESSAGGTTRPLQGLSVQKVRNGVWSQLFTDASYIPAVGTDAAPTTPDTGLPMHDLTVGVVGNQIKIQLRDNLGVIHNYPIITDSTDPILAGSVGFSAWGSVHDYYMGYGGTDSPLVTALSAFTDFDVVVTRGDAANNGTITLTNNGAAAQNIRGISILSAGGGLIPLDWKSVADNYDEPPGNGSVDPDDPWTELTATSQQLHEREQSGGNGGTLGIGQSIDLGKAWRKSRIEDVLLQVELANGNFVNAAVTFQGTPWARSDLNTDGAVNASDWPLFFPNMLTNMSSLTDVQRALAGDLDGDGDNDVVDFSLFKSDYDIANGSGAFDAMLGVPEPSTLFLVVVGGFAVLASRRRRSNNVLPVGLCALAVLALTGTASATAVDLTTFTVEQYPNAATFPGAVWTITPTQAAPQSNADASVVYSPDSALNKRFLGMVKPGTDDDVLGFVLGFEPGDAQIGSSADYLLIDWKGATQGFDFDDAGAINFHHDQTTGTFNMPVGLALSRVTGSPNADEMWSHADLPENPSGGVAELARGATRGSSAYNRANGSHLFDIRYTSTNVTVLVDGVEQFNQNGSFPDGRFGLYSAWMTPAPVFSNFEAVPITGFDGLSVTVDQSDGKITLHNAGTAAVDFDYYQINSPGNSLNFAGWNSLSDQNFQTVGPGNGQSWDEAGGSSNSALAEVYLQSNSTLAGGASRDIGFAFNHTMNIHDLTASFRLPSGLILPATVSYIGAPVGVPGDYNGNGTVDAGDYVMWRKGGPLLNEVATIGSVTPEDYTEWRARFGNSGSGSGPSLGGGAAVPEPNTLIGALFFGLLLAMGRRAAVRVA